MGLKNHSSILVRIVKMKILLILLLASAANGIHLGCSYSWYTYVGTVIDGYLTCMVVSVDFSDNSTHITGANGTDFQLEMTKIIYFGFPTFEPPCSNYNISTIPQGGMEVFPNMIGLGFRGCAINHLNGDELVDYPNLEVFIHENSIIERIPGNFFDPVPNMQLINFWSSGIRHVGHNFMGGLNYLWNVWFYDNICVNGRADNSSIFINAFIETIRIQCPDNIETTTGIPTEPPSTTEPEPPRCEIDDMVDFVCRNNEEIEELKLKVEDLQSQIDELRGLMGLKVKNHKNQKKVERNEILEGIKGKKIIEGDRTIVFEDDNKIKVFYTPKN